MNEPDPKDVLVNTLKVIFEYPYFPKPVGKDKVDYIAFDDNVFYNVESKPPILEQIVQKIAISHIFKWYESTNPIKFSEQDKNDFKYDDGFTFLFDKTYKWIIINEARNDIILFIGKNLIDVTKELIPNWLNKTIDFF